VTWALVGGEWSASRPGTFTLGTQCTSGWVDGLDKVERKTFSILLGLELLPLGLPAGIPTELSR
jgi:hypothetical protein